MQTPAPALEAFLLGSADFDRVLALQQRLIEQVRDRDDGQITLLLCEHPTLITVGRGGSPAQIAMQSTPVRNRQIEVRWVNRGGGCLMHCPGQLAIYPLVPLRWHGFSVGEFLDRFQAGIIETLDDLNVPSRAGSIWSAAIHRRFPPMARLAADQSGDESPHSKDIIPSVSAQNEQGRLSGIYGRTGQLAAFGVAVRHWVTYYGAYLNVCPPMGLFRLVETEKGTVPLCGGGGLSPFPSSQASMSCLVAERRGPVRMTAVRAALIRRLADCFGCDRYHLYTGHPLLRTTVDS
jgi:lipoyl(octanoyl) transferase